MKRLLFSTIVLPVAASAADIYKANNGDRYLLGSSWLGGVRPGPGDIAVWEVNFTQTSLPRPYLDGDFTIGGLRVSATAVQKAHLDKLNAAAPEVLTTIGAGGLTTLHVNHGINLSSNVQLSADQTWATTGTVPAAGIGWLASLKQDNENTFDFGGHTVIKNGPAQVSFSTNTNGHGTVRNGTLIMNGGEVQFQSSSQMTIATPVPYLRVPSSFTVRLNPASSLRPFNSHTTVENLIWDARVELNGGTMYGCGQQILFGDGRSWPSTLGGVIDVQANSVLVLPPEINNLVAEHKISAAITGSATLALRNNTASSEQSNHSLILTGDNSSFTGTFLLDANAGRRSVRLRGNQAGSAAGAWSISNLNVLEVENSDVPLGSLAGTGVTASLTATGGGTSLVTIGARNTSTSFAGTITNAAGSALAIRKTGTGTQMFTNSNSAWTGDTIVEAGTLNLSCLLDDASTVRIAPGAALRVKPGVTDTVAQLFLDGVPQLAGTYGAVGSTATFQRPEFTGTGVLDVQPGLSLNPYIGWIHSFPSLHSAAERAETYDADGDGLTNFAEFVTSDIPVSTEQNPLIRVFIEANGEVAYALPVTNIFYPNLTVDVRTYTDLADFSTPATPVPGWTPPAAWPALPALWDYRAFRGPAGARRALFRTTISH